jgi:hypothetical protein
VGTTEAEKRQRERRGLAYKEHIHYGYGRFLASDKSRKIADIER